MRPLCLIFFCSMVLNAQYCVEGIILTEASIPLENVTVLAYQEETIVSYTSTNKYGEYQACNLKEGNYRLYFSLIGYINQNTEINILNANIATKTIYLKEQLEELEEIVIKSERDIIVRNDSVIYNLDAFKFKSNEKLSEALKNLPGIDISKDGTIYFQGNLVSTLKIDNEDLLEGGYNVITRNLNSQYVDKVQVISNYSKNTILQGLNTTNDIAINLTFKENYKMPLSGDINASTGTSGIYEINSNLFSFKESIKLITLANLNNNGTDLIRDINGIISSKSSDSNYNLGLESKSNSYISLFNYRPAFSDAFVNFNKTEFINVNPVIRLTKRLKLYTNIIELKDNKVYEQLTKFSFLDEDDTIISQNFSSEISNKFFFFKPRLEFDINPKNKLEANAHIGILRDNGLSQVLFSENESREQLNKEIRNITVTALYTNRINENSAFTVSSRYLHDSNSQDYNISPAFFGDLFADSRLVNSQSLGNSILNQLISQITYNHKNETIVMKQSVSNKILNVVTHQNIIQTLDNGTTLQEPRFTSSSDYHLNAISTLNELRIMFGKWQFDTNAGIALNHITIQTDIVPELKNLLTYSVLAKGLYQQKNGNTFYSVVTSSNSLVDYKYIFSNTVQFDNRNFLNGFESQETTAQSSALLGYTLGRINDIFNFRTELNYTFLNKYISSNTNVNLFANINEYLIAEKGQRISLSTSINRYVVPLKMNFKINNAISQEYILNGIDNNLRDVKSTSIVSSLDMRSVFRGTYNFSAGIQWETGFVDLTNTTLNNIFTKAYLNLNIKPLDKVEIDFTNEHFYYPNINSSRKSFLFSGLVVNYIIEKPDLDIFLNIHNIGNIRNFETNAINEFSSIITNTAIIPRYLQMGLRWGF